MTLSCMDYARFRSRCERLRVAIVRSGPNMAGSRDTRLLKKELLCALRYLNQPPDCSRFLTCR